MGAETLSTPASTGTTPSVPQARSAASTPATPAAGISVAVAPERPGQNRPSNNRPPRIRRPEPRLRQLMGVCGWAAVLGGVGLILGLRGLIGVLSNDAPGWYEPAILAVGMVGIGLTVAAFLTVHRKKEPWLLLSGSSVFLVLGMTLTSAAF